MSDSLYMLDCNIMQNSTKLIKDYDPTTNCRIKMSFTYKDQSQLSDKTDKIFFLTWKNYNIVQNDRCRVYFTYKSCQPFHIIFAILKIANLLIFA